MPSKCLVITPFGEPFDAIYESVVVPTVVAARMQPVRGDEISGTGAVMAQIWQELVTCRIVISELTGRNPNVYYELGIAHALDKPTILLLQAGNELPFDLAAIRTIFYGYPMSGWEGELADPLEAAIRSELEHPEQAPLGWKTTLTRTEKILEGLPRFVSDKSGSGLEDTVRKLSATQRTLLNAIAAGEGGGVSVKKLREDALPKATQKEIEYRGVDLEAKDLVEVSGKRREIAFRLSESVIQLLETDPDLLNLWVP